MSRFSAARFGAARFGAQRFGAARFGTPVKAGSPTGGGKPRLILICGLPCSGKTTKAKRLEVERNALRLTADDWIEPLFGPEFQNDPDVPVKDNKVVHDAVERVMVDLAQRLISMGTSVVLDFGVWSKEERDFHRAWAADHGADFELVVLNPPLNVLLERLAARNADLPPQTYRIHPDRLCEWYEDFEVPTAAELDMEFLSGGTITPTVKVGDTVRRTTGTWTPRVHALLRHLENVGFDGAPRVLGIDEEGREILSFIGGDATASGTPVGFHSPEALTGAATLLRRFHDATASFVADHLDGWQFQVDAPRTGPVICHNEIGPYNSIYRDGRPIAFLDWDFAAPAPREWDIAYALWRFVPLYDDKTCANFGWPVEPRGPRIAMFLKAYGLDAFEASTMLDVLRRRQHATWATIAHKSDHGDPIYENLRREGRLEEIEANMRYAAQHYDEWSDHLP